MKILSCLIQPLHAVPPGRGSASYPNRPIRFIVPFAAGGPADVIVRELADELTKALGQPINIDTIDGMNGIVGTEVCARAAPDGYTISFVNVTHFINPSVYRGLPFDPIVDFAPVSLFSSSPVLLVTRPDFPVTSVTELIDYVKNHPGRTKYTSGGAYGSPSHVAGELLNMMASIRIPYVPSTKGHGAAGAALSEGRVDLLFDAVVSALPHIKKGEWRVLAVTTPQRAYALPDVPTVAESGLAGYDVTPCTGVVAPAGTPEAIVSLLSRTIIEIVQRPDVQARFRSDGKDPLVATPQEFAAVIRREIGKWRDVVKHAGIEVKDYVAPTA